MRKSIGLLFILWGFSQFFSSAFSALDDAAFASFKTLELAAEVSQARLQEGLGQ